MSDLATLYIKVTPEGVVTASTELTKLTDTSKKTEKATDALTASFTKMVQGAVSAYKQAEAAAKVSATEQIKAQAKINAENARYQLATLAFNRRILNAETAAFAAAEKEKIALKKHANDENAKYQLAKQAFERRLLNEEVAARKIAEREKLAAQKKANDENARYQLATLANNKRMAKAEAAAYAENAQRAEQPWKTLGIRSAAYYKQQKDSAVAAYTTIAKSASSTTDDIVRAERAKNEKLKALDKEMVGSHEMSMAAMMRAVLRFYAAYYVVASGIKGIFNIVASGVKSIDDLKVSTIAVAAQITNMQKGDPAKNYKEALKYAEALNLKLMEVDANSFANYQEIQLMNRAMEQHGVLLDLNSQKQIESFTAITNAIRLLTTGQNKEIQASQEMRALITGQIRPTDQVARMIDATIKSQGVYKDGLKEVVALGKQHGDTLERLAPYYKGIVAASGDISQTWESVKSSLATAWGIIERGLFKDVYKDITKGGREASESLKKNAESIVASLHDITNAFKVASVMAGTFLIGSTVIVPVIGALNGAIASGTVLLTLQVAAIDLWTAAWYKSIPALTTVGAKLKLTAAIFAAGFVGFEIGTWLNNFETVRKFGVYMVYGIMEAWETFIFVAKKGWEDIKTMAASAKALFTSKTIDQVTAEAAVRWTAMQKEYAEAKAARKKNLEEQLKDVTDAAIKEAAARAKAQAQVVTPTVTTVGVETDAEKKARKIREDALEQMRTDIIKNNELIDGAGKSTYEKAVARINAEAAVYLDRSKDMVAVAEWKASAMAVANAAEGTRIKDLNASIVEDTNRVYEELDKSGMIAYDNEIRRIDKKAQEYRDKAADEVIVTQWAEAQKELIKKRAMERYNQMVSDEETFSVDQHLQSVKTIIQAEKDKIEFIQKLQNSGAISPTAGTSAVALVQDNTYAKMQEELKDYMTSVESSYGTMANYADEYKDTVFGYIDEESKKRAKLWKDEVKASQWANKEKTKFEKDFSRAKLKYELGATAEAMGSVADAFEQMSQLYAEDSKERERYHKIAMAFNVAQKAALTGQAIIAAVTAVANVGTEGGWAAFAAVAAMLASMVSLLGSAGISFGGGSSGGSAPPKYTGTVLGGEPGDVSESVANSFELLKDTYDMEYRELTNIYHEMQALNQNISGLVDEIFRSGGSGYSLGIKNTKALDAGGAFVASTIRSWTNFNNILSFGNNIWGQIAMGGLGFLNNAIAKFTGSLLQSAWGHDVSKKVVGGGVRVTDTKISDLMAGQSIVGYDWAKVKKTVGGGWLHGDETSYRTVQKLMGEATTDLFTKIYSNLGTTMVELSKSFGTDINTALDYTFDELKLNLRKKSAEKINELISAKISEMGDVAAKALFGDIINQYQKIGEGLLETATRLVIDKAVVKDILDMTGQSVDFVTQEFVKTRTVVTDEWLAWEKLSKKKKATIAEPTKFFETTLTDEWMAWEKLSAKKQAKIAEPTKYLIATVTAMDQTIALSEALIALAGSLEDLQDASATYYDKFFSDEEKQIRLQEQLQGAMEDINQVLPDTRAGYRAIVEGLDLTTEAGQLAYVTMLQMAEAADQYYGVLEDALQEATDAQNEYIDSLKELIITIDEWLANLNLSNLSPVGSEAAWRAEYTKTLTAATAEGATADTVTDFLNYATKFLTYEKTYGTDSSYQAIYDAVVADVLAIRALTNTTIAGYASGTNYVPRTGPYTLHEGEIVIDRKNSDAIRSGNFDADSLGKSIAKYLGNTGGGDIKVSIQIDGREIGNVVAKQTRTNTELQTSIRRLAA